VRSSVIEAVLPAVREYLWKPTDTTVAVEEDLPDKEPENTEKELLPSGVAITYNNRTHTFLDDSDEGLKITEAPSGPLKITLKWNISGQFRSVDMTSSLVEREISMPIVAKKSYSLQECIDLFTSQEQLDENDTWYCPQCKRHQRAYKKLDLWALPKILIISLKRFQYNRYTRDKIDTEIQIQTKDLELSSKVLDPTKKSHKYDLIGISNHSGGLGSGHYTTRALNNDTWCEFNDSSAYKLNDHMPESITSREAYILFYRRRDIVSPPRNTHANNIQNSPDDSHLQRRTSESANKNERMDVD